MAAVASDLPSFAVDLWDDFDAVAQRMDGGTAFLKELNAFYTKYHTIESEYAKSLQKLCRNTAAALGSLQTKKTGVAVSGTVFSALESVLGRVEYVADQHNVIANGVDTEVVSALETYKKTYDAQSKRMLTETRKQLKELDEVTVKLNKAKKEFHKLVADESAKGKEKLSAAEAEYQHALAEHNAFEENHYKVTLPAKLSELEELDRDRLTSTLSILETSCRIEQGLSDNTARRLESTLADIAKGDAHLDIQDFVIEHSSGNKPPAKQEFEATPDEGSLGQRRMTTKKAGKIVPPAPSTPYFGSTVADIMIRQQKSGTVLPMPRVVPTLTAAIIRLGGHQAEGIFRVPASATEVEEQMAQFECDDFAVNTSDPHLPAAVLKRWLRDLGEPLIPADRYMECINASEMAQVKDIVASLPPANQAVIDHIRHFVSFLVLPENVRKTRMDEDNISMVFAPGLLQNPSLSPEDMVANLKAEKAFVMSLLCGALE